MVVHLHYDVWCLVASFIPKAELARLYSVNSAFFNMVMTDKYREARLYHTGDEETRRWLRDMRPATARRVRSLILRPHLLATTPPVSDLQRDVPLTPWMWLRQVLKSLITSRPPRSPLDIVRDNISKMTEVTSLSIGCFPSDDVRLFQQPESISLIHVAWSAHAAQLRILVLSIPLETYDEVLTAAHPLFPSLEVFNITLRTEFPDPIPENYLHILHAIAAFVNRHSRTVTGILVNTPEASVNPYYLYNALSKFPKLSELSICHPLDQFRPSSPTGIDTFLAHHAESLEAFSLRFVGAYDHYSLPTPDDLFSHPVLRTKLLNVKTLDIGLCHWTRAHNQSMERNLVRYLQPMKHALRDLSIRDCMLTLPMVSTLMASLGGSESQLVRLEVYTHFLSCQLLDVLSEKLPDLRRLELYFHNITSQDDGSQTPDYGLYLPYINSRAMCLASEFLSDLADRKYSAWALRHIVVQLLHTSGGRWNECRELLVRALPSVVTFNGVSGQEFSDVPNYTDFSSM